MKRAFFCAALFALLTACEQPLTPDGFQRRAERVYSDVNAGFGVAKRTGPKSFMARGDQVYILETAPLFGEYKTSKQSASDWFDVWREKLEKEAKARKKTLDGA